MRPNLINGTRRRERHYATAGFRASKSEQQPTAEAGLKKDDFITAVNGKPADIVGGGGLCAATSGQPTGTPLRLELADGRKLEMRLQDGAP